MENAASFKFETEKYELVKADDTKHVNKFRYSDGARFKEALKEAEIKYDTFKAVADFTKAYAESAVQSAAEFAKATLKKDKSLSAVVVETPYARGGKISSVITREVSGTNALTGKPYKNSGLAVKIKDSTVSKSFIAGIKEELTAALVK